MVKFPRLSIQSFYSDLTRPTTTRMGRITVLLLFACIYLSLGDNFKFHAST
jgi:hypothetical protein